MTIFDSLDIKIDQLKVMKMVVIHDLAEAVIGDIPSFEESERKTNKYKDELAAMESITQGLPEKVRAEILSIWHEMEDKQTAEAKLAQCLDKIEVLIQHIISDISTWDDGDYSLGPYNKEELFDFHPYLREFKDQVNEEFWQKVEAENKLDRLKPEHLERRKIK